MPFQAKFKEKAEEFYTYKIKNGKISTFPFGTGCRPEFLIKFITVLRRRKLHNNYFENSASFLERRYTQYWFILIPSL